MRQCLKWLVFVGAYKFTLCANSGKSWGIPPLHVLETSLGPHLRCGNHSRTRAARNALILVWQLHCYVQGSFKREDFKFENIQGFLRAVFENIFENIFLGNIWQSWCFHRQRVRQHQSQRLTTFINYIATHYSNTSVKLSQRRSHITPRVQTLFTTNENHAETLLPIQLTNNIKECMYNMIS